MPQKQRTPDPDRAQQATPTNQYGNPLGAPISRDKVPPEKYVPWEWGSRQKIATKQIRLSKVNVKNPGTLSNIATAQGTIGPGSTLFIIDTLTPLPPHINEMNFAVPQVAVYEGTAAVPNRQIYPVLGGSQSYGSYSFQADNDWNSFVTTTPGSIISAYNLTIHNNMGGAGTFFYVSQFKYFNFNSGTAT